MRSANGAAKAVLTVKDLHVHYPTRSRTVRAVDGVSFTVERGERFGLIGESGSGKSTIALALLRLIKPPGEIVSGEAWLDGVNLLSASEGQMRRLRLYEIALITQGAMNSLNPVMSVKAQGIHPLRAHDVPLGPVAKACLGIGGEVGSARHTRGLKEQIFFLDRPGQGRRCNVGGGVGPGPVQQLHFLP